MDIADVAQLREEAILSAAISVREPLLTSPDGFCIWCKDAPVVAGTAFCSAGCGEVYGKYRREMKQQIKGE